MKEVAGDKLEAEVQSFGVFFGVEGEILKVNGGYGQLSHKECDKFGQWQAAPLEDHGRVNVVVELAEDAYQQLSLDAPSGAVAARVGGLADTGAQICVGGLQTLKSLGLKGTQLVKPSMKVTAANAENMRLLGVIFCDISGKSIKGEGWRSTKQMVYIASGVKELFLSKRACKELGIIP